MSSAGTRSRTLPLVVEIPRLASKAKPEPGIKVVKLAEGKQITVSESHRRNRKTGSYDSGGPFYTSRITHFVKPGYVERATDGAGNFYTGPVIGAPVSAAHCSAVGYSNYAGEYGSKNESSLLPLGTTAIAQCAPTNHASDLGLLLAEFHREGIPSLPGVQTWKHRTSVAKAAGSEYLNYIFGWDPLVREVKEVGNVVRNQSKVMKDYQNGEGRNTHRRFDFSDDRTTKSVDVGGAWPVGYADAMSTSFIAGPVPSCDVSLVRETKRWFEGCFTYALPSSTDNWRNVLGYGSEADHLFGLTLTPELLWELTPWSWAVDWFSNTQDVIHNVSAFGLAGLVLRYGYMMEETIERVTVTTGPCLFKTGALNGGSSGVTSSSSSSRGIETVTKRRYGASPFGFSIGWEGLSPTQLAITAALGITKLL
jgi:hypothetical protein